MFYYIIDLSIRGQNDDGKNALTFLSENDFEEALNFNLDVAVEYGDYTPDEAKEIRLKFMQNNEIEMEVNGFMFGKTNSKDELVEEYKNDYDIMIDDVE